MSFSDNEEPRALPSREIDVFKDELEFEKSLMVEKVVNSFEMAKKVLTEESSSVVTLIRVISKSKDLPPVDFSFCEFFQLLSNNINIEGLEIEGFDISYHFRRFLLAFQQPENQSNLKFVSLVNCGLEDDFEDLIEPFILKNGLQVMNLESNSIGNSVARSFGHVLNSKDCSLRFLGLRNNKINCEGARDIAEGLRDSSLLFLDLDSNRIGDVGASSLADNLEYSNLVAIGIYKNENVSWRIASKLAWGAVDESIIAILPGGMCSISFEEFEKSRGDKWLMNLRRKRKSEKSSFTFFDESIGMDELLNSSNDDDFEEVEIEMGKTRSKSFYRR